VLFARRESLLDQVAEGIRSRHGVDTRVLVADLTAENLDDRVARGIEDLEVGLLAYNAGAVHGAKHFLDQSVEHAMTLVQLNCRGTVLLTHRLAGPMRERGRGGILLMTSLTSLTSVNHPGIAGMVHTQRNDLAHPRPIRLGKDPRDLDPARLEVDDEENKRRTSCLFREVSVHLVPVYDSRLGR
jgi:NAD(P)-dependent dehydrogenase (short-subunit alcohol dehydrogenase family)